MSESASTTTCPTCGAAAFGNFCSNCGSSLARTSCAKCGAELSRGAKFCHRCGTATNVVAAPANVTMASPPTNAGASSGLGSKLPWMVAGFALVALIALVMVQRATGSASSAAPALAENGGGAPAAGGGGAASVDISSMSPQERAERLFNRLMSYAERGEKDSVQFFAPMAIASYEMLGNLTLDQRYDLGRIAEVSGDPLIAKAQADTILASNPTHLLGLVLAANAARMQKDDAKARDYLRRLAGAVGTERAKKLPEYEAHANDINAALAQSPKK
jgi:double zinc ribbon protein